MTCQVRSLRGRDLWRVLAIERQAFPDDAWTASTVHGRLARCTRGGQARYATWLDWFIRFTCLNQAASLMRITGLVLLGRPRSLRYIVAETGAGVAGYACLDMAADGEADLQMIAVRADRRGQGIGTRLLAELIALAAARECRGVFLYVRGSNTRARDLYRRTGFTETGVLPGFYQPSGADAIVMRLPIPRSAAQPCSTITFPVNTLPPSFT